MQRCKRTPTIQINQPFNGPMMIYALQLRKQALNSHHEAVTARTAARRLEAAGWFKHQHPFIFWGQRQRAGRSLALIVAAENPPTDRIKKWMYENFGQNWKKQKKTQIWLQSVGQNQATSAAISTWNTQSIHQILSESIWKSLGSYQNPTITSK